MNDTSNHPPCALTSDEDRILRLIQEIYGDHNTLDKCFISDDKNIVIFACDSDEAPVIIVNLTLVADIAREQKLTENDIKNNWLIP